MAASYLFRVLSINDTYNKQGRLVSNGLLALLKHHKRTESPKENIDPVRTVLNYCLTEPATPASIANYASGQMLKAGIETPRKNGVMAVDIVFSLPINRHQQDTKPFFADCHAWILKNFAGELLSFDVHLDESAPHAHALILPLIDGKMQGNKLIGGKGNLMRLINLFHADVAKHYGLSRSDYKRYNSKDKAQIALDVLKRLQDDCIMKSRAWAWAREAIISDPIPLAQMLSIQMPLATQGKTKSFVDHKRSHGKGSFKT